MGVTFKSFSPEDTGRLGEIMGSLAEPGDVYCLTGDLGSGKTVFARGVAIGLGISGRVASPTFTLINEHQGRIPFYHMDVYRLAGPEDLADLGYEEYFYGNGATLVEWAGIVGPLLPPERLDVKIVRVDEDCRLITFTPHGERYRRLVEEMGQNVCAGD